DHVVLVSGFSKAYSSLAAFVACPTELKRLLKTAAPPYLYSGPSPVASLATVLAGFDVNDARGDAIRAGLWDKAAQVLDCLDRLGAHTPNRSGFPLVEVPLADHTEIAEVGRFLFDHGIYVTLTGTDVPFPSFGDALYVAVYPVLMAGLLVLVRRRTPRRDLPALIDALILSVGVGLLSWVFLIAPNIHLSGLTLLAKLVSAAYPAGDVLLLCAAIRLAVDTGKRAPAFFLLVGSIVALLTTDSAYNLALLKGTYNHQ